MDRLGNTLEYAACVRQQRSHFARPPESVQLPQQASHPSSRPKKGYLDEIEGDEGELVQVNSDMLAQTPVTLGLALGHHITEIEAPRHPSYLIPMVLGGDAHMEVVRSIHPFLSHQGLVETCAPLFDTLRAAGTVPGKIAGDLTLIKPDPSFQSDPDLTMYMKSKVLYWDLLF
eukprot:jgi/Psemu1/55789/gm1.55789_g